MSALSANPLVSLILCVKNGMPYLPQAIASVASQSYRCFELIVQDGGSTDGTLEFLHGVKGIPSIHIDSAPDTGIGQAYNRAMRRCHGDIIGSIDADNLLESETLALVIDSFTQHTGSAAIYGATKIIDQEGHVMSMFLPGPFGLLRLMQCKLVPPFSTSFFSRSVCGNELRFDEYLKTCADFDLWLRLSHLPIIMMSCFFGRTRISNSSMTCRAENYGQFCTDKIRALEQYFARYEHNALLEALYRQSIAGIYLWAAESIYRIEGASERFNQHCEQAIALDVYAEWPESLKGRIEMDLRNAEADLRDLKKDEAKECERQNRSRIQNCLFTAKRLGRALRHLMGGRASAA